MIWLGELVSLIGSGLTNFALGVWTFERTHETNRASGLMQLGQSLERIGSPVLAGLLFVTVGLKGIILIDVATVCFTASRRSSRSCGRSKFWSHRTRTWWTQSARSA